METVQISVERWALNASPVIALARTVGEEWIS